MTRPARIATRHLSESPAPRAFALPARVVDAATRLGTALRDAGFDQSGIGRLGLDLGLGVRVRDLPVLRRAVRRGAASAEGDAVDEGDRLRALVELLVLGDEVSASRLEPLAGDLVASGLATVTNDALVATARVTPWRGSLVVHDPDPDGPLWDTHVTGPNPAAETLADVVPPPERGARVLDLGTGSGLLAFGLARTASSVVATDVSEVACRYAALGAALNGLGSIEVRRGDLFAAVPDERFDVVVSNPPFVIAPDADLLFRHAGAPRDELSRAVVRGAAEHLADGGIAVVMASWIVPRGERIEAVPLRWAAGTGCDALVLLNGTDDPLGYAVRWTARTQYMQPDAFPAVLDRWVAHLERESIDEIASGVVVLRRRAGRTWGRSLEIAGQPGRDAGSQVVAVIEGHDTVLAAAKASKDLVGLPVALRQPNRLDQALLGRDDAFVLEAAELSRPDGLPVRVPVDGSLIPVMLRLDGTRDVRAVVEEVAAATGEPVPPMLDAARGLVRRLLEAGLAGSNVKEIA